MEASPVTGLPGTCGFPGHAEFGVRSVGCVRNATPTGSSVSLGRGRQQALYRAHLQGTVTVQDSSQDLWTDLDPTEGRPQSAAVPELMICSWSFACFPFSTARAEAERAHPQWMLSGLGSAFKPADEAL